MATTKKSKKLGLGSCVMILIGGMFGSAIFSLSGLTIYNAGPAAIISWFAAAPIMLIYGLLLAELASKFPKSGGVYVFPAKAIKGDKGKFLGWISCWCFLLCNLAAIAFAAIFVSQYLSMSFPIFHNLTIPLALIAMLLVFILNVIKIKNSSWVTMILVFALIAFMIVFSVVCITNKSFDINKMIPFFRQGKAGSLGFVSMIPVAIIAYSAITSVAFMASEIKDPKKTIPRASVISIVVLALLYCLILFATLGLITADYLSVYPQFQMVPLFAACMQLWNAPWLINLVSIASVIALVVSMNVLIAINSRAIKAAAEDKILPKAFAALAKNGQPIVGVIITVVIASILCLFPNYVNEIVNLGVLFNVITILIVVVAYIFASKNIKAKKKDFKLQGGIFWAILFLLIIIACNISNILTSNLLMVCVYTLVLLVVGIVIYFISKFH